VDLQERRRNLMVLILSFLREQVPPVVNNQQLLVGVA
jgi:hypothetical protein